MWVPESAEQIEATARAGNIEEGPTFDAKAALPSAGKNVDIAVDVAAMTTDGGVLLYGVAEDDHKRPTVPEPFDLARTEERISNVVSMSISEVPNIEVIEHRLADDPSAGYLVVNVPRSARAPHQVTVKGDYRFYGRSGTTNRRLTEGEVARLYQRRSEWEQDREGILAEVVANASLPPVDELGYLHAFVRPVASDQEILERALAKLGGRDQVHQALINMAGSTKLRDRYGPSLERPHYWDRRGADAWRLSTLAEHEHETDSATALVDLDLNLDGRGQLFCGRAVDRHIGGGPILVIEVVIAGNLEAFFTIMGAIYEAAEYHGHVDVGVAVTGLEGAGSAELSDRHTFGGHHPYSAPTFTRTARVSARELRSADQLAHQLLRHLYEATTRIDGFNPFEEPQRP